MIKHTLTSCTLALLLTCTQAHAQITPPTPTSEMVAPKSVVTASNAYAFPSLGMNRPSIAFVTLKNSSDTERKLVGVSADAICEHAELHEHTMKDSVMSMRQVSGITIPAQGSETLKPGGYHIMLMGIKKPLRAKDSFTLTLSFDDNTTSDVTAIVRTRP